MTQTINIEPNWPGLRRWAEHVAATDLAAAKRVAAEMGREAPDLSEFERNEGGTDGCADA